MFGLDANGIMWATTALTNLVTIIIVVIAKKDIKTIEKATNGMNDALMEATARASRAEGMEAGRLGEIKRLSEEVSRLEEAIRLKGDKP